MYDGKIHLIPNSVAYADSNVAPSSSSKKAFPCDYYNSVIQRISWAERRDRCNAEQGCHLIGRRFIGECVPIETSSEPSSKKLFGINEANDDYSDDQKSEQAIIANMTIPSSESSTLPSNIKNSKDIKDANLKSDETLNGKKASSTSHKRRVYAEIVSEGDDSEISAPLKVFVYETLTSSAVDSIRDSQQLANELAKSLVIEVLDKKENIGKLGELLEYTFASDTVLSPTRELIYWSLKLDSTSSNIKWNCQWHRNYWLGLSSFNGWRLDDNRNVDMKTDWDKEYGGREHTRAAIVALAVAWLKDPLSRTIVVTPLLAWTLQQREEVVVPLAALTSDVIPWAKVWIDLWEIIIDSIVYNDKKNDVFCFTFHLIYNFF
jgi:hypothetical protein